MIETLSLLVHADSKVGKSTLGSTCPQPILVLDAEGSWKFIGLRMKEWNPLLEAPPTYDGTWDACMVSCRDWATVQAVWAWMSTGQHCFKSMVVDSITEIQRRCKENMVGTEAMKMQDWGQILVLMDQIIRGFRDLTLHPTNPVQVVMFIAETRQNQNGKWVPYMQGQIGIALPYWMDIVGYLYVENTLDSNGQPTGKVRKLLITPHPQFEAGERVQGRLGDVIESPNVWQMLFTVFPQLAQAAQAAQTQAAIAAPTEGVAV